jgi:hypothetical protein
MLAKSKIRAIGWFCFRPAQLLLLVLGLFVLTNFLMFLASLIQLGIDYVKTRCTTGLGGLLYTWFNRVVNAVGDRITSGEFIVNSLIRNNLREYSGALRPIARVIFVNSAPSILSFPEGISGTLTYRPPDECL